MDFRKLLNKRNPYKKQDELNLYLLVFIQRPSKKTIPDDNFASPLVAE